MPLFGPPKGSIGDTVNRKVKAGRPHGRGTASEVQARQAKARKKEIKEEKERKKQEAADIRRARLLALNPPSAGKSAKFNAKAIKKGDKRREKKEQKKAERKARGFWG